MPPSTDIESLLVRSLGVSVSEAARLIARCPAVSNRAIDQVANTLARLSTQCSLQPFQLRYLIETTPQLLGTEARAIEGTFGFLEKSANFGVTEKRNTALASPAIFELDVQKELAPTLMAITAASDEQSELVLDAFPNLSAEALLTIEGALEIAYSGDDEILLGCDDGEEEEEKKKQ